MTKKNKKLTIKTENQGIILEEKVYNGFFSQIYNLPDEYIDMHQINNLFISVILLGYKIQKDIIYDSQLDWIYERALIAGVSEKYIKTYLEIECDKHNLDSHLNECSYFPNIIILYELMLMIYQGNMYESRATVPDIFLKAKEILNIDTFHFESIYNLVSIEIGLLKVKRKLISNYKKKIE